MLTSRKIILALSLIATCQSAFANPPGSGTTNGAGCLENCGHGQQAGVPAGNTTAASSAISASGSIAGATGGSSAGGTAVSNSAGGSANSSYAPRAYALSAASVGAPANDTCAAYVSLGWGLATFPREMPSCVALNEALFLIKLGQQAAAIERLCQLPSISTTSLCPAAAPRSAE